MIWLMLTQWCYGTPTFEERTETRKHTANFIIHILTHNTSYEELEKITDIWRM